MSSERQLAERALAQAFTRLEEQLGARAADDYLIPLAECLEWMYALEEHHRLQLGWPGYGQLRAADHGGRCLAGLVYARGLFTHSLVPSAHLVGARPTQMSRVGGGGRRGGGAIIISGGSDGLVVWKDLAELPSPNKPEQHGRDQLYASQVQGLTVVEPLSAADRFLRGLP